MSKHDTTKSKTKGVHSTREDNRKLNEVCENELLCSAWRRENESVRSVTEIEWREWKEAILGLEDPVM